MADRQDKQGDGMSGSSSRGSEQGSRSGGLSGSSSGSSRDEGSSSSGRSSSTSSRSDGRAARIGVATAPPIRIRELRWIEGRSRQGGMSDKPDEGTRAATSAAAWEDSRRLWQLRRYGRVSGAVRVVTLGTSGKPGNTGGSTGRSGGSTGGSVATAAAISNAF